MKKYEALFIFDSSMKDEALDKVLESIKAETEKLGGQIEETIRLGVREFARVMQKKQAGFYVRSRFQLDPANLRALQARFKLNEEIFRVQVVVAPPPRPVVPPGEAAAAEVKEDGQS